MTVVDARTGLVSVWSAQDAIPLAVAVSSSTAAPGLAPPVEIAGSVWVDGGVRSTTNADLLVESGNGSAQGASCTPGAGSVLIVAPRPTPDLAREEKLLAERGHRVRVVTARPFYKTPADLLDPRVIDIAAATGSRQAGDLAAQLVTWWDD
ncbi:patatin-like phospholipase family protein [Streptomyces sp. NPDC046870]|uniref:patatin-like phospholipase family protein n=1 Tax=Streptomyces sp. NPDC046870 TaxID=3155135 RepID=UPI003454E78D